MKKRELAVTLLASLTGIGVASAASSIVVYQKMFPRYERPDGGLTAGEFFYPRIADRLPRSEFKFKVGENRLQGYYYHSGKDRGIAVFSHGIHAGADDYLPLIEYVVRSGYDVIAYDSTGTYSSEGEGTVGMCQQLIDLEGALNFVKSTDSLKDKPLFVIGHSWGGYATASVLELVPGISAAASLSGMVSGPDMIVEKAKEYVGGLAYVPEPALSAYQRILFKSYVDYNSVRGINSCGIPVLIAHGVDDAVIRFDKQAIISKRSEITNKNASYYIGKGILGGHNSILHSPEANAYQMEIESELKLIKMEQGRAATDAERRELFERIDHRLYSAPNGALMEKIFETFENSGH